MEYNNNNLHGFNEVMLDRLSEGYRVIGFDWKYLFVNKKVVEQSGVKSKQEILGGTIMDWHPGIETTELFDDLMTCMHSRVSKTIDNALININGRGETFDLQIEPAPQGILMLSIDALHRKQKEDKREQELAKLEQLMHLTSHSLRKPVCNIMRIVNFLGQETAEMNQIMRMTNILRKEVLNLDSCTEDLTMLIHSRKEQA